MNRRHALTIASTVAATAVGATLAIAANVGLLGFSSTDISPIGALEADLPAEVAPLPAASTSGTAAPEVVIRYEDVYVPASSPAPDPASDPLPAPGTDVTAPAGADPTTPASGGEPAEPEDAGSYDDDSYDDDSYDDDSYDDDSYAEGEHENEDGDEDDD